MKRPDNCAVGDLWWDRDLGEYADIFGCKTKNTWSLVHAGRKDVTITDNVVSGSVSYPVSCKVECPAEPKEPCNIGDDKWVGDKHWLCQPNSTSWIPSCKSGDILVYHDGALECAPTSPDPLPPGYCRAGGNSHYYTCSSEPTNTEILAAVKKADTTDYVMILAAVILIGGIVLVSWLIGMNEKLDKLVKRYAPND